MRHQWALVPALPCHSGSSVTLQASSQQPELNLMHPRNCSCAPGAVPHCRPAHLPRPARRIGGLRCSTCAAGFDSQQLLQCRCTHQAWAALFSRRQLLLYSQRSVVPCRCSTCCSFRDSNASATSSRSTIRVRCHRRCRCRVGIVRGWQITHDVWMLQVACLQYGLAVY